MACCTRCAAYNARYPQPQDPALINTAPNHGSVYLGSGGRFKSGVRLNNSFYSVEASGAHIVSLSNYVSCGLSPSLP